MPTQCSTPKLQFQDLHRRRVEAAFNGGALSSDAGGLLLREVEARRQLIARFAACFEDHRRAERIEHTVEELLAQRIYTLALGYEDVHEHDHLRRDPRLATLVGREDPSGQHRLDAHDEVPDQLISDLDATDEVLHREQEGRFFHGYYRCYGYLPLYIFCGDHLLSATLRRANQDASAGALEEIQRIVGQIRERWPEVRILLRGESGFARDASMTWCEPQNEAASGRVDYVFGLARNPPLVRRIKKHLERVRRKALRPSKAVRQFRELRYRTLTSWSAKTMRANQLRRWMSAVACRLVSELRRPGLQGTEMARAQASTLRLRLLKIGAPVSVSVRCVVVRLSSAYP